jgi:23S rRNA (cytidine1920-2'-O)/16S rRNA (cytidine1409-2'-O)-methyltransferase
MNDKMRLDIFLVKKKFVDSREKAKYLIKGGCVKVDGHVITKPSKDVNENSEIILIKDFEFVGRGSYKIDVAVKHFKIDFKNKVIADVGCSIGGFTDYALKHGAKRVYAIDTGDLLHESLRKDERVIYIPNTDARKIDSLNEKIDICLIDVTFCTIEEILFVVKKWLKEDGKILGLIKPPFETGKRPKEIHDYEKNFEIAKKVADWASKNGYEVEGLVDAPKERSKQQEFFIYLKI